MPDPVPFDVIPEFQGEYRFLSNFWAAPFKLEGRYWPSVEHWFQAQKEPTPENFKRILSEPNPGRVKRLGKMCNLRPDWVAVKDEVMRCGVLAKFEQNPELARKLLATGSKSLIEGNTWGDTYWGVCKGKGENKLGLILMRVREIMCGQVLIDDAMKTPEGRAHLGEVKMQMEDKLVG